MGIRIHKAMGYGLADLKCDNDTIIDERINPDGILGPYKEENEKFTKDGYIKFLDSMRPGGLNFKETKDVESLDFSNQELVHATIDRSQLGESSHQWGPYDSIVHNAEYGLSNVLLIIPPTDCHDWCRYDDPIDYMESIMRSRKGDGDMNYFTFAEFGMFPYDFGMDSRTGEMIKCRGYDSIYNMRRRVVDCESVLSKEEKEKVLEHLAKEMGFENSQECDKYLAPMVPYGVRFIAKYTKLFRDEQSVLSLRPMIYVYWS